MSTSEEKRNAFVVEELNEIQNGDDHTLATKQTINEEAGPSTGSVAHTPNDQKLQGQGQQNSVNDTSINQDHIINSGIPFAFGDAGLTNVANVANVANVTPGSVVAGQSPQVPGNGVNGVNDVTSHSGCSVEDEEVDLAAILRMARAPSFSVPQPIYNFNNDPDHLWDNFIDGDHGAGIVNDDLFALERPVDEFF